MLSAGQQLLRADREETSPIQPRLAERLLRIARDAMAATSVTVLSDFHKGLLAGDVAAQLIAGRARGGPHVIVDPKGPDYCALCRRRLHRAESHRSRRRDRHAGAIARRRLSRPPRRSANGTASAPCW